MIKKGRSKVTLSIKGQYPAIMSSREVPWPSKTIPSDGDCMFTYINLQYTVHTYVIPVTQGLVTSVTKTCLFFEL